jgi:3'-phosphoadenosine 5'-phosphosulfate (PAPS) 3'-phosphatase
METSGVLEIIPTIRSVGLKIGSLVEKLSDSYFSLHGLSYWDTVAPLAIALEAGARCSLLNGEPVLYDTNLPASEWTHRIPLVVSAPQAHETVRSTLDGIKAFSSAI